MINMLQKDSERQVVKCMVCIDELVPAEHLLQLNSVMPRLSSVFPYSILIE